MPDDELTRLGRSQRKGAPDTFDVAGWSGVAGLLDEAWFAGQDQATRVARLAEPQMAHGKPPELAHDWAMSTDRADADLVVATRGRADVIVHVD